MDINKLYTYESIKKNLESVLDTTLELYSAEGERQKEKVRDIVDSILEIFVDKYTLYEGLTEDAINKLILMKEIDGNLKIIMNVDNSYSKDALFYFKTIVLKRLIKNNLQSADLIILIDKKDLDIIDMNKVDFYRLIYDKNSLLRLKSYSNIDFLKDNYYNFMSNFNVNLHIQDDIRNKIILMMDMLKNDDHLDDISAILALKHGTLNELYNYTESPSTIIDIIIIMEYTLGIDVDSINNHISNVDFPTSLINIIIVSKKELRNLLSEREEIELANGSLKIY